MTLVNTHGLLYVWEGSDPSLKASLFMAHTDVVPVNPATVDEWTHPPYSGFYDGKSLYGRGSVDCKDTLTAILEAVELLVASDFQPRRTIMLSFGFDEESAGVNGAGQLSAHIEKTYGKDSVAFIIDEGGGGIGESFGTAMALPGTSEKGYIDVEISLHAPGGSVFLWLYVLKSRSLTPIHPVTRAYPLTIRASASLHLSSLKWRHLRSRVSLHSRPCVGFAYTAPAQPRFPKPHPSSPSCNVPLRTESLVLHSKLTYSLQVSREKLAI